MLVISVVISYNDDTLDTTTERSATEMTLAIPAIHLNGTSAERLILALCRASTAIDDAYAKVKLTAPNGRDYYTQGVKTMEQAEREHHSRLTRLDAVKDELDEIVMAIDRQSPTAPGQATEK